MATYDTSTINNEKVDHRWYEPYLSASGNRKVNGVIPTGRYRGFIVTKGAGAKDLDVDVDPTSNDSVAVYEKDGYQQTIRESSKITLDGSTTGTGITVAIVIRVTYDIDTITSADMKLIDEGDIIASDTVIAKVDIPPGAVDFSGITVCQDEVETTRPYATGVKDGLMPAQYIAEPQIELITVGAPSIKFQLSRTVYIGTVGADSQDIKDKYFALLDTNGETSLYGSDGPIFISKIHNSGDSAEVNPSSDADSDGFYSNPWIYLDFSETTDVSFTGNLKIWYAKSSYYMAFDPGAFVKGAAPALPAPVATGLHRGILPPKYIAEPKRVTKTLAGAIKLQLDREAYFGKTGTDTQLVKEKHFRLLDSDGIDILTGTDGGPIYIDMIKRSADDTELDPSSDTDTDGFHDDSWIYLDFSETSDTSYTGDVQVWFGEKSYYTGVGAGAFVSNQPSKDSVALSKITGIGTTVGSVLGVQIIEHGGFTFDDPGQEIEWASSIKVSLADGRYLEIGAGAFSVTIVNANAFLVLDGTTGIISNVAATTTLTENQYILAFFYYNSGTSQFDAGWDLVRVVKNRIKNLEITVSDSGSADFSGSGCLNQAIAYAGALVNHSGLDVLNVRIKLLGDVILAEQVLLNDSGYTGIARVSIEGFILDVGSADVPKISWTFADDAIVCTSAEGLLFKNLKFEYGGVAASTKAAIKDPGHNTKIEGCFFDNGGAGNLGYSILGSGNDVIVRDCRFINQLNGVELSGTRCTVEKGYFINNTASEGYTAIYLSGTYGYVNNCYVSGFDHAANGKGIQLGSNGVIENVRVEDSGTHAIIIGDRCYVSKCWCNGGDTLVELDGVDSVVCSCYLTGATTDGIALSDLRCKVIGNSVFNSGVNGIHISANACIVTQNAVYGGVNGIRVEDAPVSFVEYATVTENYIDGSSGYGIIDEGCHYPVFAKNEIHEPGLEAYYNSSTSGTPVVTFSENIIIVDPALTSDGFGVSATCPAFLIIVNNQIYRSGAASATGLQLLTDSGTSSNAIIIGNKINGFITGIAAERYRAMINGNYVISDGNSVESGANSSVYGNTLSVVGIGGFNGIIAKHGRTEICCNRITIPSGSKGIYVPASPSSHYGTISGNIVQGGDQCIYVESAMGWNISANDVEGSQSEGIFNSGLNPIVNSNFVRDTSKAGAANSAIYVAGAEAVVNGNNVTGYSGTGAGMEVSGNRSIIIGNQTTGSTLGIKVGASTAFVVLGNNFGGVSTDAVAGANKVVADNIDV